uniref:Uncharacterized protein n=1 Tax=Nelumbo nucifera TaxID=4432 RepID=A0A822ZKD5_NELNU|nr:TPA_asm: hypothetical protein HUJ06_002135 [Nelumbo nucifera]
MQPEESLPVTREREREREGEEKLCRENQKYLCLGVITYKDC